MFDELLKHPKIFKFYVSGSIPFHNTCLLLGDEKLDFIIKRWCHFLSSNYGEDGWIHPMQEVESLQCHIVNKGEDFLTLKLFINLFNRHHVVLKVLPLKYVVNCFEVIYNEKYPYLIVNQDWFNELIDFNYSTYACIDFAGVKRVIQHNGKIPASWLNSIIEVVDRFCQNNSELECLTFADSVIVKASWNIFKGDKGYEPEKFIKLISAFIEEFKEEVEIDAYCIFTQGVDYVENKELILSNKRPSNHLFLNSISEPFMTAFEIDKDLRRKVKKGFLRKSQFYLESSFYYSLRRKYYSGQEPFILHGSGIERNDVYDIKYFAFNSHEIIGLLKDE